MVNISSSGSGVSPSLRVTVTSDAGDSSNITASEAGTADKNTVYVEPAASPENDSNVSDVMPSVFTGQSLAYL